MKEDTLCPYICILAYGTLRIFDVRPGIYSYNVSLAGRYKSRTNVLELSSTTRKKLKQIQKEKLEQITSENFEIE